MLEYAIRLLEQFAAGAARTNPLKVAQPLT